MGAGQAKRALQSGLAMPSPDLNSLLARAEQDFRAGRLDAARAALGEARGRAPDDAGVLHLLALVEWRSGRLAAAKEAFEAAAKPAPDDPRLAANHAGLLEELGERDAALRLYDEVLSRRPGSGELAVGRALLLQRMGRAADALAALDALSSSAPGDAALHCARGSLLVSLGRIGEAVAAYDAALATAPGHPAALRGRARLAAERGEAAAPDLYRRALATSPGDPDLILGLASALEAESAPAGRDLLARALDLSVGWVAGHELLSRLRAEAGEGEEFDRSYRKALAARPGDRGLHLGHWGTLSRAGRYAEALAAIDAARPRLGEDRQLLLVEANIASEAGDRARADRLFARLGDDAGAYPIRAWHALRCGDPKRAADLLERVVEEDPGRIAAWADLDLAWRLLGDPRHEWLSGQPGLHGAADLELEPDLLKRIGGLLRRLHRTRAHPIGESLRGGTQTRGRLFWRQEPEIAALREAIERGIARHGAGLPDEEAGHPLLRHRHARLSIEGPWSVRLADAGFHVSHIHPQGILSSACYIGLPSGIGDEASRDGWLELGRPPAELALALEPLAAIRPRPGRVALFPSYLYHGTRPFAAGERLTVAFDVGAR